MDDSHRDDVGKRPARNYIGELFIRGCLLPRILLAAEMVGFLKGIFGNLTEVKSRSVVYSRRGIKLKFSDF